MTVFPRRSFRALVAFSLFVTALVALVTLPTAATTENPCAALRDWASAYRGTSPTLDDLARFDRAQRVAIFNAVSPETRAALWQEQLQRINRDVPLSPSQHVLLQEALTLTTPALYAQETQAVTAHRTFWARARAQFSSPREQRVLFDLGAVVPTVNSTRGAAATCNCNTSGDWCESGSCQRLGCTSATGCGVSGTAPCNGLCS